MLMLRGRAKESWIGALIGTIAFFFLALNSVFSKLVLHQLPMMNVLFFEFVTCFVMFLPLLMRHRIGSLKTQRPGMHILRGVGGILCYIFLLAAIKTIPLINAILLLNTAPLWVPLVLLIWLKVKIARELWLPMIIGFIGVMMILNPKGDFLHFGSIFGVLSGLFFGITMVLVRELKFHKEPMHRIIFYFFLIGTLTGLPFVIFDWQPVSSTQLLYMILSGASYYLFQVFFTSALQYVKASTIAPLSYMTVVFSGICGFIIWRHLPGVIGLIGMLLVVTGGVLTLLLD
ncbi:MAG: DMT family transporter [Gammaproteobacteria bacterium]|nr:DMT family transporter [Gammaproteobacteria bacterium]